RCLAGPLLIVLSVLFVLRDAFGTEIWIRNPDLFGFWIPNHCYLGRSLAQGYIPEWNPFSMSGTPFAADPQSGWLYLPSMLTFPLMPCATATRVLIFLYPILAGLGLYSFLRTERLSAPAATVGGLSLAHVIAGSALAVTFSFGPLLTWIALLLACAAKLVRARTWGACAAWAGICALVLGQTAAVHLTNGAAMGTTILLAYLGLSWLRGLRSGELRGRALLLAGLILLVALVTVNAAYFVPRLAYIERTNLGLGYGALRDISERLTGARAGRAFPLAHLTARPPAIFLFGLSPGAYVGAVTLILAAAWLWTKRLHALGILFLCYGALFFALSLSTVARAIKPLALMLPAGDAYLHAPARFFYGVYVAVAVLGALGLEAWLRSEHGLRRLAMLAPGIALWGAGSLLAGALPVRMELFAIAAIVSVALLIASMRFPAMAGVLAVAVAVELVVNGLAGQAMDRVRYGRASITVGLPGVLLGGLREKTLDLTDYVSAGRSPDRAPSRSPVRAINLDNVKASSISQSMISRTEEVQGYNPFQLRRYWMLARALGPGFVYKVHSTRITKFVRPPPPAAAELFQIRWMKVPNWQRQKFPRAFRSWRQVADQGTNGVYEFRRPTARAELAGSWRLAGSRGRALRLTLAAGGDDRTGAVVLEADPGLQEDAASVSGEASFRWKNIQHAEIAVEADRDAILLVRNPFDPFWTARVDGRSVPVLRADFLFQAVRVPSGRHLVSLRYDDPWIERGMVVSGLAIILILSASVIGRGSPMTRGDPSGAGD
ncbi:MAG: hypothetical protein ACRDJ5_08240, partial [Actinomycetota bacterium]